MNYVLYHSNCHDAFGVAYAAWKSLGIDNITYMAVSCGAPLPELPEAETVYIVDFSYSSGILLELANRVKKVVVLDHHKTAQEDLSNLTHPNIEIVFDMDKSGALIAWEYFHPNVPVPTLIKFWSACGCRCPVFLC